VKTSHRRAEVVDAHGITRPRSHRRDSHRRRHRFSGQTRGGRYSRARYYHPTLQRFVSEDPVEFGAGDVNLYAYVVNNPLARFDPDGHEWEFNGNDQVTSDQLKKSFVAGVKAQGRGAWAAYEAIDKAKGVVAVGFGDLKSDTHVGHTEFGFNYSANGKLTGVSGSITFNSNSKALNSGNFTDLASAGSHEFTHVEGQLALSAVPLQGGISNLAPRNGTMANEIAAFRNQARAADYRGACHLGAR